MGGILFVSVYCKALLWFRKSTAESRVVCALGGSRFGTDYLGLIRFDEKKTRKKKEFHHQSSALRWHSGSFLSFLFSSTFRDLSQNILGMTTLGNPWSTALEMNETT